ncbi:MAG: NfeD family protein [Pseudomonadota bacterium]
MALFEAMSGMSPWIWVALGVALIALEMLIAGFIVVWPGLAALAMGALLWAAPGMAGETQIALFAVLALAITLVGRWARGRLGATPQDGPALNSRAMRLVGRQATVLDADGDRVRIEIDGVPWSARMVGATRPTTGAAVTVTRAEGMVLMVETSDG